MTRAILFDLDGTLTDTVPIIARTISQALVENGIACQPEDVYPLIGRPTEVAFRALHDFDDDAQLERIIAEYRVAADAEVESAGAELVLPGVHAMLEDLRADGFAVGIVTAKATATATHLLRNAGLDGLFDTVISTDDVANGKPAPDAAVLGLDRLGAEAAQTWYVGDALTDMEMAKAAGMRAMGITTGAARRQELLDAGADVVVDHASEVLPLARMV